MRDGQREDENIFKGTVFSGKGGPFLFGKKIKKITFKAYLRCMIEDLP